MDNFRQPQKGEVKDLAADLSGLVLKVAPQVANIGSTGRGAANESRTENQKQTEEKNPCST